MSEVDNEDTMERVVHQACHDIADKYKIDVDLVAEIISEYDGIMSNVLERKVIINEN